MKIVVVKKETIHHLPPKIDPQPPMRTTISDSISFGSFLKKNNKAFSSFPMDLIGEDDDPPASIMNLADRAKHHECRAPYFLLWTESENKFVIGYYTW